MATILGLDFDEFKDLACVYGPDDPQARFAAIPGPAQSQQRRSLLFVSRNTTSRRPEPIRSEPSVLSLGGTAPSSSRQVLINETWYNW